MPVESRGYEPGIVGFVVRPAPAGESSARERQPQFSGARLSPDCIDVVAGKSQTVEGDGRKPDMRPLPRHRGRART